ncbi:MAG: hypothetical protein IKZ49_02405 [Alphaproteobacteria bacterium]|nr:hypothetical protein [Alphaproteobacteria bacterium]
MYKIPFYIGTFLSWFIPGRENRRHIRGKINVFFFYVPIALFVKRTYGEKVKNIKFVRQISMKRFTCVVNNKYYVKIFRFVPVKRLNDYKFLLDFIRPYLKVQIPEIFVAKHIPMYVAEKISGTDMRDFDKDLIKKNEKKIKKQVMDIIDSLQKIPVMKIPDNQRFLQCVQARKISHEIITKKSVLAHRDLNASNLRLDDKLNIVSIIDWDSMCIVQKPNTDKEMFAKLWKFYTK